MNRPRARLTGEEKQGSLWDLVPKALAVLAGGITLASFVTVAGGAVHWARFDAAGLPADAAVALVGREELLVTGLSTLIPFLAAAIIALLAVYAIDPTATITPDREGRDARRATSAPQLARRFWVGARNAWGRVLVLVAVEMAFFYAVTRSLDLELNLIAWSIALAGALLTFGLAAHTEGFRWFAVAAFVAFAFFGAAVSYLRTDQSPKVRPAAVLLKNGKGVSGIYIAQTSDRIYLGSLTSEAAGHTEVHPECRPRRGRPPIGSEFNPPPRAGRIFSVLRGNANALSIGQLQSVCDALERGPLLLDDLEGRYGSRRLNEWLNGFKLVTLRRRAITAYRIYGGESARKGKWATTDVDAVTNHQLARSRLALPPGNTGACVVTVRLRPPSRIRIGHVAPAFGQRGGATQIELLGKLKAVRFGPDRPLAPSRGPCP